MFKPLHNHISSYRRKLGLSQVELTLLIGSDNRTAVSKYERALRLPNLEVAIAFEVVFGGRIQDLFPGVSKRVIDEVRGRARGLLESLDDTPSPKLPKKYELLSKLARPGDVSIIPLWDDES